MGPEMVENRLRVKLASDLLYTVLLDELIGWGARIRTSDDGVRVRCLTAWRHPNIGRD